MDNHNPYKPPKTMVTDFSTLPSRIPRVVGTTLVAITLIGLVGIVFGLMELLSNPDSSMWTALKQQGLSKTYLLLSYGLNFLISLWLLWIGTQLRQYKEQGRQQFNYYVIFIIIFGMVNVGIQAMFLPASMPMNSLYPTLFSVVASAILNGILWYYLNKPVSKASLH
jgi:uncharacterized membrane protein YvlD (DUF360 family)